MQQPFISVKDVHFSYPDGTKALFGASMDVYPGEIMSIVGQNGSGKTTIVKLFNGILKPTTGDVIVDGKNTKTESSSKLAQKVGYVYQNPSLQLFRNSVRDEVAFGLRLLKKPEEEIQKTVEESLRMIDMWDKADEYPFLLSMGEKQRVAIAAVLALGPEVLIVDEPTTGQDFKRAYQFLKLFESMNKDFGKTIIFITHEMRFPAEFSKRIVVLSDGKILMDGKTHEVFGQPEELKKSYVYPPAIVQLTAKLNGYGFAQDVLTVDDMHRELKRIVEENSTLNRAAGEGN